MSYTPEEERLSFPLDKAANALEELAAPIRARLKNPDDYKNAHLADIADLLNEVTALESRMRLLAGNVR